MLHQRYSQPIWVAYHPAAAAAAAGSAPGLRRHQPRTLTRRQWRASAPLTRLHRSWPRRRTPSTDSRATAPLRYRAPPPTRWLGCPAMRRQTRWPACPATRRPTRWLACPAVVLHRCRKARRRQRCRAAPARRIGAMAVPARARAGAGTAVAAGRKSAGASGTVGATSAPTTGSGMEPGASGTAATGGMTGVARTGGGRETGREGMTSLLRRRRQPAPTPERMQENPRRAPPPLPRVPFPSPRFFPFPSLRSLPLPSLPSTLTSTEPNTHTHPSAVGA